jgi:hypothetical protein
MAIGPNQSAINIVRKTVVEEVIRLIDKKLTDSHFLDIVKQDNSRFQIIVPGDLNISEKEYVKQQYLDAGWSSVKVLNSSDNNERPGLVAVTLGTS